MRVMLGPDYIPVPREGVNMEMGLHPSCIVPPWGAQKSSPWGSTLSSQYKSLFTQGNNRGSQ